MLLDEYRSCQGKVHDLLASFRCRNRRKIFEDKVAALFDIPGKQGGHRDL